MTEPKKTAAKKAAPKKPTAEEPVIQMHVGVNHVEVTPMQWAYKPPSVVYVSGPMRGFEDLNYPAFNRATAYLTERGFEVINPATLPADTPVEQALRIDYESMLKADFIAFLPGWQGSEGARTEYAIARSLKFHVLVMGSDCESIAWQGSFAQMSDAHLTPIEDEAWRLVYGDRGQSYGNPTADFGRTANAWSDLFHTELDPLDVAKAMISLKLSRLTHKPRHWDSWTDIIGYALCAQRIINGV